MGDGFPYPADTRAKGWRFELDHERIRQSDTWALASPEVRPWLLMLWMVAWEQTPCGSLPAEEPLIAARIGMPLKGFIKHRALLLRGWKAIDGRFFHPVLTERVCEMIEQREKRAKRVADHRARKSGSGGNGDVTRYTPVTDPLVTADVTGNQPASHPTVMTPEPEPEPVNSKATSKESGARTACAPRSGSTRLPDDGARPYPLPADWFAFARTENDLWTDHDIQRIADNFADYWRSVPDTKARKADWLATWRTWVRKENDYAARQQFRPRIDNSAPARVARANAHLFERPTPSAAVGADGEDLRPPLDHGVRGKG